MVKKKVNISVSTGVNGYTLRVGGCEYLYFNTQSLLYGFLYHVGCKETGFIDIDDLDIIIDIAKHWSEMKKIVKTELISRHREAGSNSNAHRQYILSLPIFHTTLSTRAKHVMTSVGRRPCGNTTVGDAARYRKSDYSEMRTCGKGTLREIEDFLIKNGLSFGFKEKEEEKENE